MVDVSMTYVDIDSLGNFRDPSATQYKMANEGKNISLT